jgi:multisubunit Na+/H+ antiporter MnhB subunit
MKKFAAIAVIVTAAALGFRLYLALKLPNDDPDDGRVYARIADNVLDHHSYSTATDEPYKPTLIRVPGYPIFLAAVYKVFGRDNNRAVRVIQAVLSAATCWLVALLAFSWTPRGWDIGRRRRVLLIALALAAVCPFTAIYVSTVLTETCATLFGTACALAASYGLGAETRARRVAWWAVAGVCGGAATMFRPDGAMFAGSVGVALVLTSLVRSIRERRKSGTRIALQSLSGAVAPGLALSFAFVATLTPWTVRNERVFQRFEPIAPYDATMPDEFSWLGYMTWLRTWTRDDRYIDVVEWNVDYRPLHVTQFPDYAFDSTEERARVSDLLDLYNNGVTDARPEADPAPQTAESADDDSDSGDSGDSGDASDDDSAQPAADSGDASAAAPTQPSTVAEGKIHAGPEAEVGMTPDIDASFSQIARERIARNPLRYYVVLPVRRAGWLWFDTHSQYFPFEGELLPLKDLDPDLHQQYWLPFFTFLTWLYTLLALAGAWVLWKNPGSRQWLLLLALLVIPRIAFLSSMENPEPRYVVELFTFIAAAASLPLAKIGWKRQAPRAP